MSSELSKKEFLKRYLENEKEADRKRKKKPKRKAHVPCLKIVDKDIDLKSLNFGDKAEEDEDDEAPVVAEIVDERPLEVKVKELYESSRWKKFNENPRFDSAQNESLEPKTNSMSSKQKTNQERDSSLKSCQNSSKKRRHDSDSDLSPLRVQEKMGRKRHDSSDLSPQRHQKRNLSDSDISPSHGHKQRRNKNKSDSDSDFSPPRHQSRNKLDTLGKTKSKRHGSDSDISPPRHQVSITSASRKIYKSRNRNSDSDISPPRHRNVPKTSNQIKNSTGRHDSDSDMSPPRSPSELSSSKDKMKKLGKTLSGLKAGLQNSKTLQKEILELKEREKKQLSTLDDEISGRNAGTIVRDRKTGLKRDLNQEQQMKNEENKKTKEYQQKYTAWGKGIEQTLDKKEQLIDDIYEMSKPLARYQDDEDLDERLKSIIHDDDPMLEYIKKKRQKDDTPKYPVYSGPPAPPNRFGILPGYRWDGVDRSNGFEKKYFEKINKSKAVESEAYLWSVQDM